MATDIFRSVGITGTDLGGAETMQIVGSTMTTSAPLAPNIGLGDAITYNDGSDRLAFIHGRTSSTVFTVQDKDGAAPTAASAGQAFGVFRCYTSLANAEAGTENANITEPTENDVNPSLDLVAADIIVNFACYTDGSDTSRAGWSGRTTSATQFVKVFTPVSASEVGVTQRHPGVLVAATLGYRMDTTVTDHMNAVDDDNIHFEGLQLTFAPAVDSSNSFVFRLNSTDGTEISYCIVKAILSSGTSNKRAIQKQSGAGGTCRVWNNLIYDFDDGAGSTNHGIRISVGAGNLSANTVVNCFRCIEVVSTSILAKANIAQATSEGYLGAASQYSGSLNNVTDEDAEDGNFGDFKAGTTTSTLADHLVDSGATFITDGVVVGQVLRNVTGSTFTHVTAINSETDLTVNDDIFTSGQTYRVLTNIFGTPTFTDAGADDFELAFTDTVAKGNGIDLSAADPAVTDDIKGRTRSAPFDIGAFIAAAAVVPPTPPRAREAITQMGQHPGIGIGIGS